MKLSTALAALSLSLAVAAGAGPSFSQVRPVTPAVASAVTANLSVPYAGAIGGNSTIVEFLDYNCPYCKKMHPELQALLKADPKVRIAYKDWPIFGEVSTYAAQVALAANWQGKYLAAHDALIGYPTRLDSRETVRRVVKEAGIDLARLDQDMSRRQPELAALLARSAREAKLLGLAGTPAFLIGTTLVPGGLSSASLQRLVQQDRTMNSAHRP